jgi:hypothetical protein
MNNFFFIFQKLFIFVEQIEKQYSQNRLTN